MVALSPVVASQSLASTGAGPSLSSDSLTVGNEASFARAIQFDRLPDVIATPVSVHGMASHVTDALQSVSSKLANWQAPATTETGETGRSDSFTRATAGNLTTAMAEAVSGLQGAYVFAIQATLVSRGSTEGTKILNTLLKGQ
ncbi:MAG: hypothetical protein ACRYG8_06980 [Janthinobacterium lividum]